MNRYLTYFQSRQKNSGTTIVEFAVVASLFIAIVFAIIEFGLFVYNKQMLTNASREAARKGIVMRTPRVSDAEIIQTVNRYTNNYLLSSDQNSNVSVSITPPQAARTGNIFGTELVVRATYPHKFFILSGFSRFGLKPITIEAETRMRME